MRHRTWILYAAVISIFCTAHLLHESALRGWYHSGFVAETLFPGLHRLENHFTDYKFRFRREHPKVQNKVVIVDIDGPSLAQFGRWPWNRNLMAALIDRVFQAGAKVVALDIFFSEPQETVPSALQDTIAEKGLADLLAQYNYDQLLSNIVRKHREKIVLGWGTEAYCRPVLSTPERCPLDHFNAAEELPKGFQGFAIGSAGGPEIFPKNKSPLISVFSVLPNIPLIQTAALHSGFVNSVRDADGVIRRAALLMMVDGKPHPSLPLEAARLMLGETLQVTWDRDYRVKDLRFAKSNRVIPTSPLGMFGINFKGEAGTIPLVSAVDLLTWDANGNRQLASSSSLSKLQDAAVFIGVSALAVGDIIATPLDHSSPGVEVQATILENLLTGDGISNPFHSAIVLALLLSLGAALFVWRIQKLEARPVLLLSLFVFLLLAVIDLKFLFERTVHWNTSMLAAEYGVLAVLVLAMRYMQEEQNRKYLKDAFGKYVSPAIVDSIIKDRNNLSLGGKKENLTVLFSDIRGFTTLSETMDPKQLGEFIIEYNSLLTDIIFETGGTLDKYIGDALMAFWGAPLPLPDHARRACEAAVKMYAALENKKADFKARYGIDVRTGMGLNTGLVTVGNMGSRRSFGYTVIGDQVNLASRLEGVTKLFGVAILTTEFTLNEIVKSGGPLPPHRVLGGVKVKGKTKAVNVVELLPLGHSTQGFDLFEEGKKYYIARDFAKAIASFQKCSELIEKDRGLPDGPSQTYLAACKEALESGPLDATWDGSFSPEK